MVYRVVVVVIVLAASMPNEETVAPPLSSDETTMRHRSIPLLRRATENAIDLRQPLKNMQVKKLTILFWRILFMI